MATKSALKAGEVSAKSEVKAAETKQAAATGTKDAQEKPVKKAATKTAAKKAVKSSVTVQIEGRDILTEDLVKRAEKEFKKLRKGVEIKTIEVYVNVYEAKAYYVVNKEPAPEFVLDI